MSSKPAPSLDPTPAPDEAAGDDAFRLDAFLPYRLSLASNRVSRAFARRYAAEFGLTIPEWRVLAVLGSYAPVSSNEIVARTAMDKAKVSRAVARLVEGGLILRAVDPADQRLIRLTFSRRGRAVYEAIVPRARALEAELLDGLGPRERAALAGLLDRLLERAAAMDGDGGGDLEGD